jgi:stage V sporulation protein SpoVS
MRKAVIDLGTNTFNLLIADVQEGRFDKILSTKIGVALGMGGILQNVISEDAFIRGIQAMREFKGICEDHEVIQITAIGTSALRDATNAVAFRREVKDKFGIEIQIVDGEKTLESRETHSLKPYVGKRVAIVRTGEGKAKAIGEVTVGEPIVADEAEFRKRHKEHLVPVGSQFDIKKGQTKHLYPMLNPVRYEKEKDVGHGILARKVNE